MRYLIKNWQSLRNLKHFFLSASPKQNMIVSSSKMKVPQAPYSNSWGSSPKRSSVQPIILLILINRVNNFTFLLKENLSIEFNSSSSKDVHFSVKSRGTGAINSCILTLVIIETQTSVLVTVVFDQTWCSSIHIVQNQNRLFVRFTIEGVTRATNWAITLAYHSYYRLIFESLPGMDSYHTLLWKNQRKIFRTVHYSCNQ